MVPASTEYSVLYQYVLGMGRYIVLSGDTALYCSVMYWAVCLGSPGRRALRGRAQRVYRKALDQVDRWKYPRRSACCVSTAWASMSSDAVDDSDVRDTVITISN